MAAVHDTLSNLLILKLFSALFPNPWMAVVAAEVDINERMKYFIIKIVPRYVSANFKRITKV